MVSDREQKEADIKWQLSYSTVNVFLFKNNTDLTCTNPGVTNCNQFVYKKNVFIIVQLQN